MACTTGSDAGAAPATRAFWWACALAAPPVALAAASLGFGMTAGSARDLALLGLASIAEEIVFRGAIQPALARAIGGRDAVLSWLTASNVATSVVFAAAHLWKHPPLAALAVFPVSLVYGMARERSGRIWPAALLHVWFNAVLVAASRLVA